MALPLSTISWVTPLGSPCARAGAAAARRPRVTSKPNRVRISILRAPSRVVVNWQPVHGARGRTGKYTSRRRQYKRLRGWVECLGGKEQLADLPRPTIASYCIIISYLHSTLAD